MDHYRFLTEKHSSNYVLPLAKLRGWGTPYDGLYGQSVEKSVILVFKRPLIEIFRTDAPYSRII